MDYVKSPIFYMGNKYDLLSKILPRFPLEKNVDTFIDLFGGSGTVSLNVPYKNIIYNELNDNIVNLFKMFKENSAEDIISHIQNRITEFNLPYESSDVRKNNIGKSFKPNYEKFRSFYNKQKPRNYKDLYTLTYFSFCNLIRFNSKSEFNMPIGNQYFTQEHKLNIQIACNILKNKSITFENKNAFDILSSITKNENQFIYLDPPYSNTMAIYNEQRAFGGWQVEDDIHLFTELDRLNKLGVKWAMSNVLKNKGKENVHIRRWANKNHYKVIYFEDKNYASLGKGNAESLEVMICNYEPPFEQLSLFEF